MQMTDKQKQAVDKAQQELAEMKRKRAADWEAYVAAQRERLAIKPIQE